MCTSRVDFKNLEEDDGIYQQHSTEGVPVFIYNTDYVVHSDGTVEVHEVIVIVVEVVL